MTFTAGQKLTATALNQIIRNDKIAVKSGDYTVTTSAADLTGMSMSVTTPVANTILLVTIALDAESTGVSDFPFCTLVINGATQSDNLKFQVTGRIAVSSSWVITVASASTFTVKAQAQKSGTANTCTIYGTHSKLIVSGNGIS